MDKEQQRSMAIWLIAGGNQWLSEQLSLSGVEYNSVYNAGQIAMALSLGVIDQEEAEQLQERNRKTKQKMLDKLKPQA